MALEVQKIHIWSMGLISVKFLEDTLRENIFDITSLDVSKAKNMLEATEFSKQKRNFKINKNYEEIIGSDKTKAKHLEFEKRKREIYVYIDVSGLDSSDKRDFLHNRADYGIHRKEVYDLLITPEVEDENFKQHFAAGEYLKVSSGKSDEIKLVQKEPEKITKKEEIYPENIETYYIGTSELDYNMFRYMSVFKLFKHEYLDDEIFMTYLDLNKFLKSSHNVLIETHREVVQGKQGEEAFKIKNIFIRNEDKLLPFNDFFTRTKDSKNYVTIYKPEIQGPGRFGYRVKEASSFVSHDGLMSQQFMGLFSHTNYTFFHYVTKEELLKLSDDLKIVFIREDEKKFMREDKTTLLHVEGLDDNMYYILTKIKERVPGEVFHGYSHYKQFSFFKPVELKLSKGFNKEQFKEYVETIDKIHFAK